MHGKSGTVWRFIIRGRRADTGAERARGQTGVGVLSRYWRGVLYCADVTALLRWLRSAVDRQQRLQLINRQHHLTELVTKYSWRASDGLTDVCLRNWTLWTQDTSEPKYFGPTKFVPKCPDTYDLAYNCGHGSECPDVLRHFGTGFEVSHVWILGLKCPGSERSSNLCLSCCCHDVA